MDKKDVERGRQGGGGVGGRGKGVLWNGIQGNTERVERRRLDICGTQHLNVY